MLWCQWIPGLLIHIYFGAAGVTDQKQKHLLWQSAPPNPTQPNPPPSQRGMEGGWVQRAPHQWILLWWERKIFTQSVWFEGDPLGTEAAVKANSVSGVLSTWLQTGAGRLERSSFFFSFFKPPPQSRSYLLWPAHTRSIKHTLKFLLTFRIFCNVLDNSNSARFQVKHCIPTPYLTFISSCFITWKEFWLYHTITGMETTFFSLSRLLWLTFLQPTA